MGEGREEVVCEWGWGVGKGRGQEVVGVVRRGEVDG